MLRKGDIAARITTTVVHYGFGTGRAPTSHSTIEIVQVSSATKDGKVKSYQTRNGSPVYKQAFDYGKTRWLEIGGENQAKAARLYEAATSTDSLRFDDPETAKAAIAA